MEAVFDLSLPTSWEQLTDKQLRLVFALLARDLSAAEVKTLCLMKWAQLRVINEHPKGVFLVQRGKQQTLLSSRQIQQATSVLDFLDALPPMPVRLARIGRHRALTADFEKVPFEKYLYVENLFHGFLHTESDDLLFQMTQVLYDSDSIRPTKAELVNVFYWFASLKQYFSKMFPHFYTPMIADNDNLMGSGSLYEQLREATNAQLRALTGGDITKERVIALLDTHRALTELDAKAREAEEYRKSIKSN